MDHIINYLDLFFFKITSIYKNMGMCLGGSPTKGASEENRSTKAGD